MLLRVAGWGCAALLIVALVLQRSELPKPEALDPSLAQEPRQQAVRETAFLRTVATVDYSIQPLHRYELRGLVVSTHDTGAWWDWIHKATNDHLNVADICVVWGANATSGAYRGISFSNGQWTCEWSARSNAAWQAFDQTQVSNNHLLASDPALARRLKALRAGDQIAITGTLAEYRHRAGRDFFRGTSTVRDDSGNGACETIHVDSLEVLQPAPRGWRTVAWGAALGVFVCLAIWWRRPHDADRA